MEYKRQYRQADDSTKDKMSAAAKGKQKTADHRAHISRSMIKYWASVPNRPSSGWTI